jgi:hypothetical protein
LSQPFRRRQRLTTNNERTEEVQQITKFEDETPVVTAGILKPNTRPPITTVVEERTHSIEDIFSRPTMMLQATWTTGTPQIASEYALVASTTVDPNGTARLASCVLPYAVTSTAPNMYAKIAFFCYFRANIKLRIMVNAMQCHQGRLLCVFRPYVRRDEPDYWQEYEPARQYLSCLTSMPHCEVNLESGNVAEMEIPFCMPYEAWSIPYPIDQLGTFEIYVLNGLRSGESTSVSVTVYGWFTDVQLTLPTAHPPDKVWKDTIPTVADPVLVAPTPPTTSNLRRRALLADHDRRMSLSGDTFVAEVGPPIATTGGKDEAQEKAETGIVTRVLGAVADVAGELSELPIIGVFAKPISWIARGFSFVAEYFGWCKPQDLKSLQIISNVPAKGFTNCFGVDSSVVLGAAPDNSLAAPQHHFATKCDEMDLTYMKTISSMLFRWTWMNSMIAKHKLGHILVTPVAATNWVKLKDEYWTAPTMVHYLASMFGLWSGSLKYRFSATKTGFHSGRLLISYSPGDEVTPDFDLTSNSYTWVWDLRETSELEIEIPYVSTTLWKVTANNNPVGFQPSPSFESLTGIITVFVLNPLISAGVNVWPMVDINVWIAGGKDLEFAMPNFSKFFPFNGARMIDPVVEATTPKTPATPGASLSQVSPQSELPLPRRGGGPGRHHPRIPSADLKRFHEEVEDEFVAEVGYGPAEVPLGATDRGGVGAVDTIFTVTPCLERTLLTCGERITSLRQLIKRFGRYYVIDGKHDDESIQYRDETDWFQLPGRVKQQSDGSIVPADEHTGRPNYHSKEPMSYIAPLYGYWCGAKRYKYIFTEFGAPSTEEVKTQYEGKNSIIIWSEFDQRNDYAKPKAPKRLNQSYKFQRVAAGTPHHIQCLHMNNILEVEVPFYSNVRSHPIGYTPSTITGQEVTFTTVAPEALSGYAYSAAGDDFSFGFAYSPITICSNFVNLL